MKKIALVFFMLLTLAGSLSFAHPGHGYHDGYSPMHYWSSPVHIASFVVIAAVTVFFAYRSLKRLRDRY